MLKVFNRDRKLVAYLENAFDISEDLKINAINYLNFSLPIDDPKLEFIQPFWYVKTEKGLYRILPKVVESEEIDIVKIECEHVLATLLNDVMVGNIIYGNLGIYTRQVINFVLNKQKIKNWVLGDCDFSRQFEYCWEHENLASALFSIPKPLGENYIWEFETENYPWKIHLRKLKESKPSVYIRPKKNQVRLVRSSDPKQLFTRIYPFGYGEGVNQLDIKDVNNGINYLQSPKNIVDKYGLIETIWIDRRYENAESLRDAAQVMLDEYQEPLKEYELSYQAVEHEDVKLGDKIRIFYESEYFDDYVVGIKYNYDDVLSSSLTIANKGRSVAGTIADLADRQRIEMSYSQGATQLYAQSLQVNAAPNDGAELNFYIPQEMRVINKVIAKIKIEQFRSYSKATDGGGGTSKTTESGGFTATTTEFGGASYPSTNTEPGDVRTSTPYFMGGESIQAENDNYHFGTHNHAIPHLAGWKTDKGWVNFMPSGAHNHGTHDHQVVIPAHNHSVQMGQHTHSVTVKSHEHRFTLPDHEHKIKPGIFKYGSPSSFSIKVNNKVRASCNDTQIEVDITDYLLDKKRRISRGSWQSVEIIPNDLAYVSIDLTIQGFVQSRGDYTV